jgi:hypothetical protein
MDLAQDPWLGRGMPCQLLDAGVPGLAGLRYHTAVRGGAIPGVTGAIHVPATAGVLRLDVWGVARDWRTWEDGDGVDPCD